MKPNHAINADSEKRRSFVATLFTAGYVKRSSCIKTPFSDFSETNFLAAAIPLQHLK